jgi:hypothetical protein
MEKRTMATAATNPTTKRKGINSGVCNEFAAFFKIRPGHLEQLKVELAKRFPTASNKDAMIATKDLLKVSNHHVKHYLFDNETRLALILSFDQSFDTYFDDFLALAGVENFYSWLQHCVEIPEGMNKWSIAKFKDTVSSVQTEAFDYIEVIPDMTIQEIAKAQKVMKAFQQVLDNPAAAKALQDPALKPLLEQAAN